MYIIHNNTITHQIPLSEIDSIMFETPVLATINVTGVSISPNTLYFAIGMSGNLTATVTPADATNPAVSWSSSHTNIATVDTEGVVTAHSAGNATITATTEDGGHTAAATVTVTDTPLNQFDVGVVINGIRWATRNVDMPGTFAQNPESAGRFFQWGTLGGVTHDWASTGTVTGWNTPNNREAWTSANDPCPPDWRVPTQTELTNLRDQPNTWTTRNGVNGRLFGTAPYQIFLPAAGRRNHINNGALLDVGTNGTYWSSEEVMTEFAFSLWVSSANSLINWSWRASGFSVRCVAE